MFWDILETPSQILFVICSQTSQLGEKLPPVKSFNDLKVFTHFKIHANDQICKLGNGNFLWLLGQPTATFFTGELVPVTAVLHNLTIISVFCIFSGHKPPQISTNSHTMVALPFKMCLDYSKYRILLKLEPLLCEDSHVVSLMLVHACQLLCTFTCILSLKNSEFLQNIQIIKLVFCKTWKKNSEIDLYVHIPANWGKNNVNYGQSLHFDMYVSTLQIDISRCFIHPSDALL